MIHCIDTSMLLLIIHPLPCSGPATPPSPPHSPSGTNVSSSSFQANWLRPLDNGRLPLQNYTVEILNRGNEFCEGSADWQSALLGIDPDAGSAQVNSLLPYTGYEFRVVAFNSVYRSAPSVTSGLLETAEAGEVFVWVYACLGIHWSLAASCEYHCPTTVAPSEAPTQVQARSQQDHSQLLVTWQVTTRADTVIKDPLPLPLIFASFLTGGSGHASE